MGEGAVIESWQLQAGAGVQAEVDVPVASEGKEGDWVKTWAPWHSTWNMPKVWTISSYKTSCDSLQLRGTLERNSGVSIHEIPDRGGRCPQEISIINLEGAEPEGIQHALAVPTSPFSPPFFSFPGASSLLGR